MEKTKWCYGCNETKPLTHKYWAYANKEHTKFRNKCRKCTNFESKISHRIHFEERKKRQLERSKNKEK